MITSDELLVRLLLTGYRSLARPVLFTLANGDPEEIHQHVITLLSEIPRSGARPDSGVRGNPP